MADQQQPRFDPVFIERPEKIDQLVRLLTESEKTTSKSPRHFVEPFRDAIAEVRVRRAQLVFGRRGSGKTSLLRRLESDLIADGHPVAFVDVNAHIRGRREDSIISILVSILTTFERWPKLAKPVRESLKQTTAKLEALANKPSEWIESEAEASGQSGSTSVNAEGRGRFLGINIGGGGAKRNSRETSASGSRTFTVTKSDALDKLFGEIEKCVRAVSQAAQENAYVIVDDFYNLNFDDQPYILDALRRICQTTNVWLKVGTVRHRSNVFVTTSSRPVGMQVPDDAAAVQLDRSLENFAATRQFLRKMTDGILAEIGVDFDSVLNPGGFNRLVQASGGVARDFIYILRESIAVTRNRLAQKTAAGQTPLKRMIADDIWITSARLSEVKRTNFKSKTDLAINREKLLEKVNRMLQVSKQRGKNCVLILNDLPDTDKMEIEILLDWKFLHLMSSRVQINFKDYSSYMVDLGEQAHDPAMKGMVIDLSEEAHIKEIKDPKYIYQLNS
jgi:hypothetical protein